MSRLLCAAARYSMSLGIMFVLLGTLALPQLAFGDSDQTTQCSIYCQQTYTGQQLDDCRAACQKWYGATCGSDCSNCGGNNAAANTTGNYCNKTAGTPDTSVFSCQNWCVCGCVANFDFTYACTCGTGVVGSGGSPPGF